MRNYEGTFRIRFHADKGITLDRGIESSTLTAEAVHDAVDMMMEAAEQYKCGIDRWSMYIPGVSEKLAKDATQIPVAKVKAALKDDVNEVTICAAKFGKPRINIAPMVVTTKKASKFVDIA